VNVIRGGQEVKKKGNEGVITNYHHLLYYLATEASTSDLSKERQKDWKPLIKKKQSYWSVMKAKEDY